MFAIFDNQRFNDTLTKDIVSFQQLGPGFFEWQNSDNPSYNVSYHCFHYIVWGEYGTYFIDLLM